MVILDSTHIYIYGIRKNIRLIRLNNSYNFSTFIFFSNSKIRTDIKVKKQRKDGYLLVLDGCFLIKAWLIIMPVIGV